MHDKPDSHDTSLIYTLGQILHPLVEFALAKRIPIQSAVELLKRKYVLVSQETFSLPDKRLTDSRISVLTGLQRKDIKTIRASDKDESIKWSTEINPLSRLIAHWSATPEYQNKHGTPLPLAKTGQHPSFETLVRTISKDIHPRTMLDDLDSLGLIKSEEDKIILIADAFIPQSDEGTLLKYLANNLGDHAKAAVANVLASPKKAPHFERAVHYNTLTPESLNELETLSRELQQKALEEINAKALTLQKADTDKPDATGRFRCGVFIYSELLSNEPKGK